MRTTALKKICIYIYTQGLLGADVRTDFCRFSTIPASATPFLLPGVIPDLPRWCWNEEEGRRDRDWRSTMIGREVLSEIAAQTSDRDLSGLLLHSNTVGGGLGSHRGEETALTALEWWKNGGNLYGKPEQTSAPALKCGRPSVLHPPAPATARLHPRRLQQRPRPLSLPAESVIFQFSGEITQNFKQSRSCQKTGKERTRRGGKVIGNAAGVLWDGGAPSPAPEGGERTDVRTLSQRNLYSLKLEKTRSLSFVSSFIFLKKLLSKMQFSSLQTFVFLLLALFCGALTQTSCLNFNYPTFEDKVDDEDFIISKNSSIASGAIQVTRDFSWSSISNESGRFSYKQRFKLWGDGRRKKASFNSTFVINISNKTNPGAEGLAFILAANSTLPENSNGQWLGIVNANSNGSDRAKVVAVEFDTSKSYEQDLDDNHVGVDVNSIYSRSQESLTRYGIKLSNATEDGESTNSTAEFFRFALRTGQGLTVVRLSVTISILDVGSSRASIGKERKKERESSGERTRKRKGNSGERLRFD
ncbi:hypothetical protein ACLB2K_056025 [Fragaria x ananassa]